MLEVRRGGPSDIPALAQIFWRGVHEGAAPKYSAAQRAAWLPEPPTPDAYAERLERQVLFVADRDGAPVGFMTLRPDGYLDFAFVLPEERGCGTADALLAMVENHSQAAGLARLTVKASDMARPFLARHGWHVTGDATVTRDDVTIPSFHMARDLVATDAGNV
ncbi:MAG: GNAT family N-acetyltransferase [Pseudomonadota bacterium]